MFRSPNVILVGVGLTTDSRIFRQGRHKLYGTRAESQENRCLVCQGPEEEMSFLVKMLEEANLIKKVQFIGWLVLGLSTVPIVIQSESYFYFKNYTGS